MNSSGQAPAWRPPFTPAQWQELEHQALIFKYLMAGIPVPPDLLVPIRKGLDSMASRFFHHASMGYCSYGKKLDPEPGRCRRTDGKKWRCSKDAYPDSKYCERHMHRGRNRSRKPVEAQSQTLAPSPSSSSSPSSTVTSLASGGAFNSAPASVSFAGPSLNQLQIDLACHGLSIGDHRFGRRARPEVEEQSWNAMHVQARTAAPPPLQELSHGTFRAAPPPTQAWGCFDYAEPVKQDTQNFRTFFDDWPKARESWSELEDERSGAAAAAAVFPATQLSISIPMASSDFSTASSRSPNDERESLGA